MTQQHICVGPVLRQPGAVVVESDELAGRVHSTASCCDESFFGAVIRLPVLVYVVTQVQEVIDIILAGDVAHDIEKSIG